MKARVHDFTRKLRDPTMVAQVERVVRPATRLNGDPLAGRMGPISINLDLTAACNYACTHCIDTDILNTGHRFTFNDLLRSLVVLRLAGLRSVILCGGGEPTLYPRFADVVVAIKTLGLQCGVVSNGSHNQRIATVAAHFTCPDWVRLSLDAATDKTFARMHHVRARGLTLTAICSGAVRLKAANPELQLGFSFIIAWPGATVSGTDVIDNVDEIASAAQLARDHGFDYIAFKPLLDRGSGGSEIVQLGRRWRPDLAAIRDRITAQLSAADALAGSGFRVLRSVNLLALQEHQDADRLTRQPRRCHMHHFRQVITPIGIFGCPVYRGADRDRIGEATLYRDAAGFVDGRRRTAELVAGFDAAVECSEVSCLYNETNWWLDRIADGTLSEVVPAELSADFFL
jgi:pyruvate-formate lyase-activating enzyme